MEFKGAGIKATEADIAAIAADLGVPYYRLRGVIEVEAPRGPFDKRGRPTMLFEPFQFYKRLPAGKRKAAVAAGCAMSRRPKQGEYPAESYTVLAKAMDFDADVALQCCSWGRGQVMGFNFRSVGYSSVFEMVEAAKASEADQLRAMANFIRTNRLVQHLKTGNAESFAEGFNGAGYARDGYHTKIRAAWAKWQKRPVPTTSLPTDRPDPVPNVDAPPASRVITDKKTVMLVQGWLRNLGYTEVGKVDGGLGDLTKGAIRIFRAENGLPNGDFIDDDLIVAIAKAEPRKLSPARTDAKASDVRETVPEARKAWYVKLGAGISAAFTGILSLFGALVDYIAPARAYLAPVKDALGDVPGWVWTAGVFVVAVGLWRMASKGESDIVDAVRSGARR
jgi:hypothetical protein